MRNGKGCSVLLEERSANPSPTPGEGKAKVEDSSQGVERKSTPESLGEIPVL